MQTGGAQRYCGRPDKGRTKPDGRSGCTRASAGWIVYQGRGVDVGLGSVLSPPKLGLHKSRFSRFGPSLFLAAATSNSNSPKRPAFFNLNQEQLLLLSPRGRSVPEPERNGWSEAHCPLRREQGVRRSAVCRRGDGTAIGSGSRTCPGTALPRSRSRGFDPACLRSRGLRRAVIWDGCARPSDGAAAGNWTAVRTLPDHSSSWLGYRRSPV